jgi:hypothetical protein
LLEFTISTPEHVRDRGREVGIAEVLLDFYKSEILDQSG